MKITKEDIISLHEAGEDEAAHNLSMKMIDEVWSQIDAYRDYMALSSILSKMTGDEDNYDEVLDKMDGPWHTMGKVFQGVAGGHITQFKNLKDAARTLVELNKGNFSMVSEEQRKAEDELEKIMEDL